MRKLFSGVLCVLGSIQLVWSYFSGNPLVPAVSIWLQSKGYGAMNANLILGLIFILFGLLIWRFGKPKILILEIDSIIFEKASEYQSFSKGSCRVRIINQSESKQARDLKVELVKINPVPKIPDSPKNEILPVAFPLRLNAKDSHENIINPKGSLFFELFSVKDGQWKLEVEFFTEIQHKVFVFETYLRTMKDASKSVRPFDEYYLTIAASADYFPRKEKIFKMIISDNTESPIVFTSE
jgi:hypothetical protein